MKTIIYRHRKENRKKCSLSHLEKEEDFLFFTYPKDPLPDISSYCILTINAPILTKKEKKRPILLIDGTWKRVEKILQFLPNPEKLTFRSLPPKYLTAYPRKQTACPDPKRGLASIEALFLAFFLLGRDTKNLLDHYYWKEKFLTINQLQP